MRLPAILALITILAACSGGDVSRAVGARCDDSAECDDRCLMPSDPYPGGFCTLSCDDDADCPDDARCVDDEGGVCLFTCADEPACDFLGVGWTCVNRLGRPEGDARVCRGI